MITTEVDQPVHIVVVGAGPAGATFAMLLVQFFREKDREVKVTVYESRIIKEGNHYRWRNENDEPRNKRRRQVITLQNSVLELLPDILNAKINESQNIEKNVWKNSINIPIMEYEDMALKLIQEEPFNEMITISPQKMEPEIFKLAATPKCDLLVFADGSSSVAFNHPGIHKCSFGHTDYALGVPYHVSQPNSTEEATRLQNLNVAITVGQTRYLMNSLRSERGYINIRLNSEEFKLVNQGDTLDDIESRASGNEQLQSLCQVIMDGLSLFGIDPTHTQSIDKFPIQMHYASCRYYQSGNYANAPICLIGNAAMSVHFWPGRGANSGIKSAYALAHEVEKCSSSASRPYFQANSNNSLAKFESFMAALICREQCGRSGIIAEVQLPTTTMLYEVFATERKNLIKRILKKAAYFDFNSITERHIVDRLQDVSKPSLFTMYNSRSWPAMGSCDSDPRDYFKGLTLPNEPNSCSQQPRNLPTNQSTSNQNVPTRGSEFWFLDKEVNIRQTRANNRHLWFREDTYVGLESNTGVNYPWIIRRLIDSNYYSIQCSGDCQVDGVRYKWLDGRLEHRETASLAADHRVPEHDKYLMWEIIESEPNVYMFRSVSSKCWLNGPSDDSPAIMFLQDSNFNQYFAIEELNTPLAVVPTTEPDFWFLDKEVNIRQTRANNRHLWFKENSFVGLELNNDVNYPWIIRRLKDSHYYSIQCGGDCQIDGVRYQWLDGRLLHREIVTLAENHRDPDNDKYLKWEIIEREPNVYVFRSVASKCWLDGRAKEDPDDSPAIVFQDSNVNQYFGIEELYTSPAFVPTSGSEFWFLDREVNIRQTRANNRHLWFREDTYVGLESNTGVNYPWIIRRLTGSNYYSIQCSGDCHRDDVRYQWLDGRLEHLENASLAAHHRVPEYDKCLMWEIVQRGTNIYMFRSVSSNCWLDGRSKDDPDDSPAILYQDSNLNQYFGIEELYTSPAVVPPSEPNYWFLDKEVNIRQTRANSRHLWLRNDGCVGLESNTGVNYPWIIRRLKDSNHYSIQCSEVCHVKGVKYQWLDGRNKHFDIVWLGEHDRVPDNDDYLKWEIIQKEPNVYMFKSVSSNCWLDGRAKENRDDSPAIVYQDSNLNQYFGIEELYDAPAIAPRGINECKHQ